MRSVATRLVVTKATTIAALTLALASMALVLAPSASAQVGIRVVEVPDDAVRVDGSLRDFRRIQFANVGSGPDASMRYALGASAAGLYVAVEVADDRMVRTARPTTTEDAIVLTLAMPDGHRYVGTDIWLFAGIPGRQASVGAVSPTGGRPSATEDIRVVEGPRSRGPGYVLEAFIPWRLVRNGGDWQRGRAAIRLRDVDTEARPEVESEPSSATVDERALDRLPTIEAEGGEAGMLRSFLAARSLQTSSPTFDLRGDVGGDARPERIVLVDTYLVIMGPGYRNGEAFDFLQLPIQTAGDVRAAELIDVTGDGKRELAVVLRQRNDQGSRDLWQTFSFANDRVAPLFGVEVRKETGQGIVDARLRVRPGRRGAARIEVATGRADGLDPDSFREASATGVEAILLPWGPLLSRSYQWDGDHFAVVDERPNPRARAPRTNDTQHAASSATTAEAPPRADVGALLALFRRQASLPESAAPRIRRNANVAEDRGREDVLVFGTSLVIVGAGFRGGRSYFQFQIPVGAPEEVLEVKTADLTGDGRDEILITIRRAAGNVLRDILLVHQMRPSGFPRLAMIEVGREQDGKRIENEVRIAGQRRGARTLEIRPGRARGWDASSWPFADTDTGDGVDPLLLPWRDEAVRYHRSGDRFVR